VESAFLNNVVGELAAAAREEQLDPYGDLITKYASQYGEPIVGRTRAVFIRDDEVIKIPFCLEGLLGNWDEANHTDPGIPLARCRLESEDDCKVLIMERVEPLLRSDGEQLPEWTDWVDGQQVGYTLDGRLVAFDL